MMNRLKSFMEMRAFGVCTYIGNKIGIRISKIRLFFIYATFITLGSPILIYLSLAFLLNIRQYMKRKKGSLTLK